MSYSRQKPRSYTYRIPLDDRRAVRKVHYLDALHDDYWITEVHKSKVPNGRAVRHWACKFYKSTERFDYDRNEMVGGAIPGLHKYRYSLDWERTPETELLEMRHANSGGTKIRGEKFIGTEDGRLPDYVPVDTVVPWTPGEIKAMFDGEPVPDRQNYSHDPPEIEAEEARQEYRELIELAAREGLEKCREKLHAMMDSCPHDHVLETGHKYDDVAYCEDCGMGWDAHDYEHEKETGGVTIVGTA